MNLRAHIAQRDYPTCPVQTRAIAGLELTEQQHRLHANRGMGATKAATQWIAGKNARGWACQEREAKARKLLAELGGRTMASFSASKRLADEMERAA